MLSPIALVIPGAAVMARTCTRRGHRATCEDAEPQHHTDHTKGPPKLRCSMHGQLLPGPIARKRIFRA